jgi:hypothetical protein
MITALKFFVGVLLTGLVWLVGSYTAEYFRPYKK